MRLSGLQGIRTERISRRISKEKLFDTHKAIPEAVHRRALSNAFANGVVSKYDNLIPTLQSAYEAE